MRKFALAATLALLASQSFATGLKIEVEGEANGTILIDLFEDTAPNHVAQITAIAAEGGYDTVVFHRVIDRFMAQTGDVSHGRMGMDMSQAGFGSSDRPDLKAEFSDLSFERGIVGMGRKRSVDSANAQFFIMFDAAPHLNGQYTVVGKVTKGMDIVDAIKRGHPRSGTITGKPDMMKTVTVTD